MTPFTSFSSCPTGTSPNCSTIFQIIVFTNPDYIRCRQLLSAINPKQRPIKLIPSGGPTAGWIHFNWVDSFQSRLNRRIDDNSITRHRLAFISINRCGNHDLLLPNLRHSIKSDSNRTRPYRPDASRWRIAATNLCKTLTAVPLIAQDLQIWMPFQYDFNEISMQIQCQSQELGRAASESISVPQPATA